MTDINDVPDPLGYLNDRLERIEQAGQQQQQTQQFVSHVSGLVNQFKAGTPDYEEALSHVIESRRGDLKAMGLNDLAIDQVVTAESEFIAKQSIAAGKNPAEAVYEMAINRGFACGHGDSSADLFEKARAEMFFGGKNK